MNVFPFRLEAICLKLYSLQLVKIKERFDASVYFILPKAQQSQYTPKKCVSSFFYYGFDTHFFIHTKLISI